MAKFVMIVGPQAVGKMTVGQELAKQTGYKLFYNHMSVELVRLIFDYSPEVYGKVNCKIRKTIFNEFSKSNEKGIIFTACLDFGAGLSKQLKEFNKWIKGYEDVYIVELVASLDTRLQRNKSEHRLNYKPSKRNIDWSEQDLLLSSKVHSYNSSDGQGDTLFKHYLKINNEDLSAEEAARIICNQFML